MRRVKRIETMDGTLHETEKDARRHAERAYGDALRTLATGALTVDKYDALRRYHAMQEFIDANLPEFLNLAELKNDLQIEEDEA